MKERPLMSDQTKLESLETPVSAPVPRHKAIANPIKRIAITGAAILGFGAVSNNVDASPGPNRQTDNPYAMSLDTGAPSQVALDEFMSPAQQEGEQNPLGADLWISIAGGPHAVQFDPSMAAPGALESYEELVDRAIPQLEQFFEERNLDLQGTPRIIFPAGRDAQGLATPVPEDTPFVIEQSFTGFVHGRDGVNRDLDIYSMYKAVGIMDDNEQFVENIPALAWNITNQGDVQIYSYNNPDNPELIASGQPHETNAVTLWNSTHKYNSETGRFEAITIEEVSAPERFVEVNPDLGSQLNLRSGPGTNFAPIGQVDGGTRFKYLGQEREGFYLIETEDGQEAWVSGQYTSIIVVPAEQPAVVPVESGGETTNNQNLLNLENYNGIPWSNPEQVVSFQDRIEFLNFDQHSTQGTIAITDRNGNRREYPLINDGSHDGVSTTNRGDYNNIDITGNLIGILGTRSISNLETLDPQTGRPVEQLSFTQVEIVDLMMAVNVNNRQTIVVFSLPKEQIYWGAGTPVPTPTEGVLTSLIPGSKINIRLVSYNVTWDQYLTNWAIPLAPERELPVRQSWALKNRFIPQFNNNLMQLSANDSPEIIYGGPTHELDRFT